MPVDARVNGLGSLGRGPVTSFGRWQDSELEEDSRSIMAQELEMK